MRPRLALVVPLVVATPSFAVSQQVASRAPIIDVHLHATPATLFGKPPMRVCAARLVFPGRDPRDSAFFDRATECDRPLQSPESDEALMARTLEMLRRYNIVGVTSGVTQFMRRWKAAAPERIIPSVGWEPLDSIRRWAKDGGIAAMGELAFQYGGLSPSDSLPESYLALAEELDLPVGLHMGLGPPGAAYGFSATYRARHGNPLLLEDVLVRHPKLRLYVMHAGWPMLDEMIALLYAHPQVYVDVAVIDWAIPRAEFHHYLKRLVDAGFGKRIMFGSDQMIWPDAIPIAIDAIESAPFLTPAQKRDIFYNNAVRFFRLDATRPVQ